MWIRGNQYEQIVLEERRPVVKTEKVEEVETVKEEKESIHHFTGTVANSSVHMSIRIDGTSVKGKYYYDSQRANGNNALMIVLGRCKDGNLELTEYFGEKETGIFRGEWTRGQYSGLFTRKKDGKIFQFYFTETNGGEEYLY